MDNGSSMGTLSTQGAIIVPDPSNSNQYYYFNFSHLPGDIFDFQYSVVDMSDGMGRVIPGKKRILLYHNTSGHLSAVRSASDNSIWVICHERFTNCFLAYKVTPDSLCTIPVKSYAGSIINTFSGYMKISPDGHLLGLVSHGFGNYFINILSLNPVSGQVTEDLMVHKQLNHCYGCEFSPDNSKFYVLGGFGEFYQYDLKAGNSQEILDSQCRVTLTDLETSALQLGPDGKIYMKGTDNRYLAVINDPNKRGFSCGFVDNALYLGGNLCYLGFPSFIQSYLNDPEFSVNPHCSGQPTQFNITNLNGIDSVEWKFNDPGNAPNDTSTLFAPLYQFSAADTFYVSLTVHSGLIDKTVTDTVIIYPTPHPELPNDTTFCPNDPISLILDAGPGEKFYWNGSLTPGNSTFAVSDTGTYWVRVNNHGCIGTDAILVSRYPVATADTGSYTRRNSNCNQSDGAITGIVFDAQPPFTIAWTDASGTPVGTGADLTGIPAGSYTATVTFGSECSEAFGPFPISDNGAVQIAEVIAQDDRCGQSLGSLLIVPETGPASDYLYSINGAGYVNNAGLFENLPSGPYTVTLKNQAGCISAVAYDTITDLPGPGILCIPTPASGSAANGSITVISSGSNLTYQLEGYPAQTASTFSGLVAATYYVTVTDEYGCIARDTVVVESIQGSLLVAMAGEDKKCLYKPASSNIRISRVNGLKQLKAVLYYNDNVVRCTSFNSNDALFADAKARLYSSPPRVEIEWNGTALSTTDTLLMGSLIFETLAFGNADINWNDNSSVTWFLNETGDTIQPVLIPGSIQVHEIPQAHITGQNLLCEGDNSLMSGTVSGGTDPVEYHWITPAGLQTAAGIPIENAALGDAGLYSFVTRDRFHCVDTARIQVQVHPLPNAGFTAVNDTIWFENSYLLEATPGYASYSWNTGETKYYITVSDDGLYSVIISTDQGCRSEGSVTMLNALVPIQVPNAFTPNGDGLNDAFSPVVDRELVRSFHMVIYNRWGQLQYETSDASEGWDGKDALPGAYVWVITYENRIGKAFDLKGTVMVVR